MWCKFQTLLFSFQCTKQRLQNQSLDRERPRGFIFSLALPTDPDGRALVRRLVAVPVPATPLPTALGSGTHTQWGTIDDDKLVDLFKRSMLSQAPSQLNCTEKASRDRLHRLASLPEYNELLPPPFPNSTFKL